MLLPFNTCCYNVKMRPANQSFKMRPSHLQEHVRESDHILHQIGQMKETVSPYLSNTKMSDGQRQKWFQYLPNENAHSNNYGSVSREQNRNDNYLHSLERRLQKLFREEKEMLKERHHKNQQNQSQFDARYKRSITSHQASQNKPFEGSYQIENMDRKIRELEERYRKQDFSQKNKQKSPAKQRQIFYEQQRKMAQKDSPEEQKAKYTKEKVNYDYSPTYKQDFLTQSVEECINKQKNLQEQVESLKKSVREIHQNNKSLLKRIQNRDQKKKHKQRTKQLLKEIIHKLEFINIQIKSAKKRESKQNDSKIGKIQRQTNEICQQFQKLRLLYKHLQGEKAKFQKKQIQFEKKIEQLSTQKNQENH